MSRYIRSQCPGGTFFFTVVTLNRKKILLNTDLRSTLRLAINSVREKYDFKIDAWVMLPDHLHCIWTLPEGDSDYVKRWALIKRKVTQELSDARSNKGEGIIWQRRYWEHKISCDNDYQKHMDYIHYNPVKHGVVKQVKDWRFSSFHRLVRDKVYPLDWGGSYQEQFCNYGE